MNNMPDLPIAGLPIPILVCDTSGIVVAANERAQQLFNCPLQHRKMDELLDFKKTDIRGCSSFSEAASVVLSRSTELNALSLPFKKPPISYLCLYFSRLEHDGQDWITVGIQDISDHQNHIKTFKYQQNLLDNIVATTNDALVVFDGSGFIELFNPTAEQLFGL